MDQHFTPITLPPDIVMAWQDRRVGTGYETAEALSKKYNRLNWRGHPQLQRLATEESLDIVGWADAVKVSVSSDKLWDGHLRVEIALTVNPQQLIPVDYYGLTPEQEDFLLTYFDQLGAEAVPIPEKLSELMKRTRGMVEGREGLKGIDEKQLERVREMLEGLHTPDLDDLYQEYGDPQERDFWPFIKIQVSPECKKIWDDLMSQVTQTDDEAVKVEIILGAVQRNGKW